MPDVAQTLAELDSIDIVEGLVIKGGPHVEVLNAVSLHGGLTASWPVESPVTSELTIQSLVEHWRAVGLPAYAQFDNDPIFHGTHRYPDALGLVIRLCLSLKVVPVFVPSRATGFQAMIESYNGWWQSKVWSRFQHHDLVDFAGPFAEVRRGSVRKRSAERARIEAAPDRRGLPCWLEAQTEEVAAEGRVVYLRRSRVGNSAVLLMGETWPLGQVWPNRLVRCEVSLDEDKIRFFTLRRKEPTSQPQILEVDYRLPNRGFQD